VVRMGPDASKFHVLPPMPPAYFRLLELGCIRLMPFGSFVKW
jgi:hypothetical protein